MFSSNAKIIVYITSKGLHFKGEGISETETLAFLPENVKNLEVINRESFKTAIYTFIGKVDIKRQKVVFVLGEDLLFEKVVPLNTSEEIKEEQKKFLSDLSFSPEYVVCVALAKQKEVYFVATNKDIYTATLEGFESMGWKVQSVVPVFVFPDVRQKETITPEDVKKMLKDVNLLTAANFLTVAKGSSPVIDEHVAKREEKVVKEGKEEEKKKEVVTPMFDEEKMVLEPSQKMSIPIGRKKGKGKRMFVLLLLLIVVFIIIGGSYFAAKKKHIPLLFVKPTPTVMPTPIPTMTPTPQPSVAKKDLVVQILNGTTIPGLASKVKTQLANLGYTNTTTGNADNQNATQTTIGFSSKVSSSQQTEIITELKKTFGNITTDATILTANTDIKIITASPQ